MAENTLIPNTFQHPNAYIDWLSYYLTPEEEKVLNKAIREIIGWHSNINSRRSRIAIDIFVNGKFQDGRRVAMGCGLSRDAVRNALKNLHAFNILVKVGEPTNEGQEYELNLDYDSVKWEAIKLRREARNKANQKRTSAAREAREEGVLSDSTEGVLSDSTKETHIETQFSAPQAEQELPAVPVKELEYVDDDDIYEDESYGKRPKWATPETDEQKEFLAVCGAKWFESKQKRKAKAIISALRAGDIAGRAVYLKCLEYLEGRTELVDVPPILPRDWYDQRAEAASSHRWTRWGFINALLNIDLLVEHCRIQQRNIDRAGPGFTLL